MQSIHIVGLTQISSHRVPHSFLPFGSLELPPIITVKTDHSAPRGRFSEASNVTSDSELQISGDLLCTEIIIKKINSLATRRSGIWVLE